MRSVSTAPSMTWPALAHPSVNVRVPPERALRSAPLPRRCCPALSCGQPSSHSRPALPIHLQSPVYSHRVMRGRFEEDQDTFSIIMECESC